METAEELKAFVESGKAVMGIELGSTRIKAVLIDDRFRVVAQGAHDWENSLVDGVWSYSLDDVGEGVRDAFAKCAADVEGKCGAKLERLAALGVSGMMHGYLPFDGEGRLLVPFRTWRNVMTADAAAELTDLFKFNIPQRWSIAHYYQAILRGESHVGAVRRLTTLAGYVHKCLSGEDVLGVGEASGMFPVDPATCDYNAGMLAAFDAKAGVSLKGMLPRVLKAGEGAGTLTVEGARWLDPSGTLKPGALMAPPEGDAGTGMVATNAVAPGTGNVSAGTSVFAMVVLDEPMKGYYPEVDVVTTPTGREVAMVHCNNCTNEINAWVRVMEEAGTGREGESLYARLFEESLKGDADCGGVVVVPFLSGEPVAGVADAMLRVVRRPDSAFTLANFFRAQIYSAFVSLRIGMELLIREGVKMKSLVAHGGIFKTRGVAQRYLAYALRTPVTCLATASEGGPWGMAVLAAYAAESVKCKVESVKCVSLEDYLANKVFADAEGETIEPAEEEMAGFDRYLESFKECVSVNCKM